MIVLAPITGINYARREARPRRGMIAAVFGILFLGLIAAVPLANAGLERAAAAQRAEARI